MDRKGSILIIDDDEAICDLLEHIFSNEGYETKTAFTGLEAIEKAKENSFNFALLDIKLPDIEGIELLSPLKEINPEIKVIMITAYASVETAVRALNEGAFAYITKPFNIEEVLKTVNDVFEKQRLIEEKRQTEERLRESEAKFRTLAEQSPNMIFINIKGKVAYANQRCEELMGYTREEFYSPDFDFLSLIAPESRKFVQSNFEKHMRGEELEPYEYSLITRDGKKIEAIITSRLIDYEGERAVLGTVTDITERKIAEKALETSKDLYKTLASLLLLKDKKRK